MPRLQDLCVGLVRSSGSGIETLEVTGAPPLLKRNTASTREKIDTETRKASTSLQTEVSAEMGMGRGTDDVQATFGLIHERQGFTLSFRG